MFWLLINFDYFLGTFKDMVKNPVKNIFDLIPLCFDVDIFAFWMGFDVGILGFQNCFLKFGCFFLKLSGNTAIWYHDSYSNGSQKSKFDNFCHNWHKTLLDLKINALLQIAWRIVISVPDWPCPEENATKSRVRVPHQNESGEI